MTTRANSGWKATTGELKEGSIEFEMVWNTADAAFTRQKAVRTAWGRGGVVDAG